MVVKTKKSYIVDVEQGDFETRLEPVEDSIIVKETDDGFELRYLVLDEYIDFNPRTEQDNLAKIVCFHGRYVLGDKHNYDKDDYSSWGELEEAICKQEDVLIIKPLFLYDHSGITIRTHSFSCQWDSGQVGFVYITKENVEKMCGEIPDRDKLDKMLEGEMEVYDDYLRGEVYSIVKETYDKDKNQIDYDIVGGYIGRKWAKEALKEEV